MADGFSLTIWRVPGVETSGKIGPKIVALMLQNPTVTIPDLANALKRTERTIERLINQLKSNGFCTVLRTLAIHGFAY